MFTVRDLIDYDQLEEIRTAINDLSWEDMEAFERVCPVESGFDVFVIKTMPKNRLYSSDNFICLKKEDPYKDFWQRWRRFCKLKAFW